MHTLETWEDVITHNERHTNDHPFCGEQWCWCHVSQIWVEKYLKGPIREGLLTEEEARRLFWGEMV